MSRSGSASGGRHVLCLFASEPFPLARKAQGERTPGRDGRAPSLARRCESWRLISVALPSDGFPAKNVVAERKFSDMLERAMRAYNNRSLTAAEVIAELVEMAKQMKAEHDRGTQLGLRDDELAFYDAVCQNDSAIMEMGDDLLKQIAQELVTVVRANTTVDWDKKEQVRASLRRHVKRLLVKYDYPPDKQESAIQLVMQQAERLAAEVAV